MPCVDDGNGDCNGDGNGDGDVDVEANIILDGSPASTHSDTHTHSRTPARVHLHNVKCLKRRVEHARYTFSRRCGFTILIKSYTRTTWEPKGQGLT